MKNWLIAGGIAAVALLVLVMYASASNQEVAIRNQAEAIQLDLHNELDNTTKKISQTAQVTQAQMATIKEIIIGNAQARGKSGGSLATMVHESVPDLAPTTPSFTNLQNIIAGARDRYAGNQKLLIDVKREHENLLSKIPSSWFVGGRPHLKIVIVTSTRTEDAFATGVDDDDSVFKGQK